MNKEILKYCNTEAGRYLLGKLGHKVYYPIVQVTHNSFIEHIENKTYRGIFFSRNSIYRIFVPVLDTMKIAEEYKPITDSYNAFLHYAGLKRNSIYPQIFLDSNTYNSAAGANSPVDGIVWRTGVDQTFTNIQAGAGTNADVTSTNTQQFSIVATATSNQYGSLFRCIQLFDTSNLGANAAISAATLSEYFTSKTDGLTQSTNLCSASPAANNTLATSDYATANFGTTKLATDIAYSAITINQYTDYALNASGVSNINLGGISKFGARLVSDITSAAPTWSSGADSTLLGNFADSASNKPKLVVTFTTGGGGDYAQIL